jgi:hypothetical protein
MIQVKELRNKTNDVLLKKELDCQIAMLQQQHEKMAKKTTFKRRKALKIQKQLIQFRNIRNEIGELLREESREGPQGSTNELLSAHTKTLSSLKTSKHKNTV